jgi:hypothetical protein
MDLKKELLEFLEANNNFGLEEPEKVVDIYIEVYKKQVKHEPLNQNKMTAVEWLQEKYKQQGVIFNLQFEQAKEMEKEHLYNFYMQGGVDAIYEADRNVEQYYNETFKSQ